MGALVNEDSGSYVVPAKFVPDERALGGPKSVDLLRRIMRELERSPASSSLGPHLVFGEVNAIPEGVIDSGTWIQTAVLPVPSTGRSRPPSRVAAGQRFLRAHGLDRYVRQDFDPTSQWRQNGGGLRRVSQYVQYKQTLLLLEPLTLLRPNALALDDARDVNTTLMAYRWAHAQRRLTPRDLQLAAYVLPGGDAAARAILLSQLDRGSYSVFDAESADSSEAFIDLVSTSGGQVELDATRGAKQRARRRK